MDLCYNKICWLLLLPQEELDQIVAEILLEQEISNETNQTGT